MSKPTLPSVYALESYAEAIRHALEHHGEEGKKIVSDPDQPPIIWHQFSHLESELGAGTWDHEHEDTVNPEIAQALLTGMLDQIKNPLFTELVKIEAESGAAVEAAKEVDAVLQEHGIDEHFALGMDQEN